MSHYETPEDSETAVKRLESLFPESDWKTVSWASPSPKRANGLRFDIFLVVVLTLIVLTASVVLNTLTSNDLQPAYPAAAGEIATFVGTGGMTTSVIQVPAAWRLAWSCQGIDGDARMDLAISTTGTLLDSTQTTCRANDQGTQGYIDEYHAGTIRIKINTDGVNWRLQVLRR